MQHATVRADTKWHSSRLLLPTPKSKLLGVFSILIGFAIIATFVLV